MMLFYSKTRKMKYFLPPPPKKKKQKPLRDTNGRDIGNMHKCLSLPAARDLDIY